MARFSTQYPEGVLYYVKATKSRCIGVAMQSVEKKQKQRKTGIVALSKWADEVGIARVTAWRFRKRGWLKTVNICGRVYITQDAIDDFVTRAASADFAQLHKVPMSHALAR